MNEQIFDAIFVHVDIDFNVEIERRENFDAMIEREIISIQNIDFFDVASVFDVISKNENFEFVFDELKENVKINVDSFDDENVAKDVNIVIIVFDINENVIDANIASSFDVNFANFAFDVNEDVNVAISFDVIIANSFNVIIANSFDM